MSALLGEIRRLRPAAAPTPAAVRSFNEQVRTFVAADESRAKTAARVLERVRNVRGAPPLPASSWESLNFFHLEAALAEWLPELDLLAAQAPSDLRRQVTDAERRLEEAEAAVAAATQTSSGA